MFVVRGQKGSKRLRIHLEVSTPNHPIAEPSSLLWLVFLLATITNGRITMTTSAPNDGVTEAKACVLHLHSAGLYHVLPHIQLRIVHLSMLLLQPVLSHRMLKLPITIARISSTKDRPRPDDMEAASLEPASLR
jgi:hypothetical protein